MSIGAPHIALALVTSLGVALVPSCSDLKQPQQLPTASLQDAPHALASRSPYTVGWRCARRRRSYTPNGRWGAASE